VDRLRLFALSETQAFAARVSAALGVALSQHEERAFEDGEHKTRPMENVRGKDVFVLQSLYGEPGRSVNDKLCRLLFFIGALKDASASPVTAVIPYLCYARKDRRSKTRDPITTRYVAQLMEAIGVDHVMVLDVHNPAAYQNAFRFPADHLEARTLFVEHFAQRLGRDDAVVVSPDVGGVKRAEQLRQALSQRLGRDVANAFLEKYRSAGVVSGEAVVGDITGKVAIIIDDLISTGGTILRAARACRQRDARAVYAAATHGVFIGGAAEKMLADRALDGIVVTDTIPVVVSAQRSRLTVLDTAPLFAEAIRRSHTGESLTELFV
jgi:ribose-phosphate pyrophosphokinase